VKNHELEIYRIALLSEKAALSADNAATVKNRDTVTLDQQSVGRLSRMDALQQQAMAQATQRRRDSRSLRIDAALKRMDIDEFGYCLDCGDLISKKRLDLDPTVPACLSCAKG